jgi:hypothetical protein
VRLHLAGRAQCRRQLQGGLAGDSHLTNLAGEPLVDSSVGGAAGAARALTAAGARLLRAAEQMDAARHDVLARINDPAAQALAAPRTSMRNHLPCTVARLDSVGPGDPLVRVVLALPEGGEMTSLITRERPAAGPGARPRPAGAVQGDGGAHRALGRRRVAGRCQPVAGARCARRAAPGTTS